jgi:hypothetical protein
MLYAQSEKKVVIVSAHGGPFVLVRDNGVRQSYNPVDVTTGNGITLKNLDMIQTTPGVFVEVRVLPGTMTVYIAESSSVVFEDIGGYSSTQVISLLYGRIRVDQQDEAETTIVKSGVSITEIQKGSINIDYIVNSSEAGYRSQPLLYVSAMSGSAVLVPSTLSPTPGRIKINRNETLSFDALENKTEKTTINKEIPIYWADNTTESNMGLAGTDTTSLTPENMFDGSGILTLPPPQTADAESVARLKTGGIITGLVFMLAGVVLQTTIHYMYDSIEKETADIAYYSGFLPIGMGAFILIASYLYPSY